MSSPHTAVNQHRGQLCRTGVSQSRMKPLCALCAVLTLPLGAEQHQDFIPFPLALGRLLVSPPTAMGSGDQQPTRFSRNGIDLSLDLLASVAPHCVTPAAMADPGAGVPSPDCNFYGFTARFFQMQVGL